ncbi:NADPH-dependent 7-cyano-7-deazaguanine reductase QueF [Marinimicrobium sp. ABcell2]|uniref:NADPH-dependent 7-cyano-7-deazaguanine reductase QueF n=1 Tax=Marinimicrobium sp. ABcell2 TaxID=3069751 RepID=UPI0027B67D9E|nr:NADPH-dependent 7-cyano-7-deazaguanine reductase QueF [Marinimicrobium sp. ABcell2]MDQ2075256.1 NADPH-dependent 7-cyano-7-deazaguanine reductase QueF [Marinimicrobium sp. ABcell2]
MSTSKHNPLGRATEYVSVYSPELLYPINRSESRETLGLGGGDMPFFGVDIWTGYEVSWLDDSGKPQVALAEFRVPCDSEFIVESKSFKLYLNSFNQTRFAKSEQVSERMVEDLSRAAGATVAVTLQPLAQLNATVLGQPGGECLDALPLTVEHYHPEPGLLAVDNNREVKETLYSDLLKTNCPVTGQPDWASVQIHYQGRAINRTGLLAYIISFREHQDFHEHCVERMFVDLMARCQPQHLSVFARYTRRGGLDINPFRSTDPHATPEPVRLVRQ